MNTSSSSSSSSSESNECGLKPFMVQMLEDLTDTLDMEKRLREEESDIPEEVMDFVSEMAQPPPSVISPLQTAPNRDDEMDSEIPDDVIDFVLEMTRPKTPNCVGLNQQQDGLHEMDCEISDKVKDILAIHPRAMPPSPKCVGLNQQQEGLHEKESELSDKVTDIPRATTPNCDGLNHQQEGLREEESEIPDDIMDFVLEKDEFIEPNNRDEVVHIRSQLGKDEDWNDQPSEDSLLVAGGWDLSLPRARRHGAATTTASTPTSGLSHGHVAHDHHHIQTHYPPPAVAASPPRRARQRSPSPGPLSPRDRFKDAKEKFLLLEREELTRRHDAPPPSSPPPPAPAPSSASLPERGGGGGGGRARLWSRASDDDLEDRYYAQPPLPHPGQHQRYEHLDDSFDHPDASFSYHQPPAQARRVAAYRHHPQEEEVVRRYRSQSPLEERGRPRRRGDAPAGAVERMLSPRPAPRQHAPPPEDAYRPPRHHQPPTHHPHHQATSEHSYDGRHPAADIPLHRYRSPGRSHGPAPLSAAPAPTSAPAPAPAPAPRHRDASPLGDAYSPPRGGAGYDKRRSMFDVLEDERRRNSNELAREFKRRSYQDAPGMSMSQYQELADHERFPGLDRETARMNHHSAMVAAGGGGGGSAPRRGGGGPPPMGPPGGGYRHSYAEGALPLHRTNSSVSSGRVGLAAVHPY